MSEAPSIIVQAKRMGCAAAFYDFRKAKTPDVDYYNSALVRRNDGLWLITRRSTFDPALTYGWNSLMAFKLDDQHLPQYGIPIVVPRSTGEHFEDPRVCVHGGRYYLSACNFIIYPGGKWTGAHQVLIEVDDEWRTVQRFDPVYGKNGPGVKRNRGDEKNWLWFWHGDELLSIYSTTPHVVLRWNKDLTVAEEWKTHHAHPEWSCGLPRGGTAPVRVGDEYFSFFHSSMPWQGRKRRYYMGAYTFEARPPFTITRMTPRPLLTGSLRDPWAEGKPLVVFPCSAILDNLPVPVLAEPSKTGEKYREQSREARVEHVGTTRGGQFTSWTVSLGVNDLVSAWFRISHAKLLQKLDYGVMPMAEPVVKNELEGIFR